MAISSDRHFFYPEVVSEQMVVKNWK